MRNSNFKKGDRIRIRDHRAWTESEWLFGEIVRGHPNRQMIVIRLEDESLRAWPRKRVYKI